MLEHYPVDFDGTVKHAGLLHVDRTWKVDPEGLARAYKSLLAEPQSRDVKTALGWLRYICARINQAAFDYKFIAR